MSLSSLCAYEDSMDILPSERHTWAVTSDKYVNHGDHHQMLFIPIYLFNIPLLIQLIQTFLKLRFLLICMHYVPPIKTNILYI